MLARANLWRSAVAALLATGIVATAAADRIAYQGRLVMGSRGIVVMSGTGENPVELPLPSGSDRITPALSPDGAMVAYAAKAGETFKLWVVRLADDNSPIGEPRQLTAGQSDDEQPAWSPDGQRIAYVSGTGEEHAVVVVPFDGGSPKPVTSLGSDFRNACPHWSPDGERIVYSSGGKLFVIGADGGNARELVDDGMYPSWSPDGSQIAFFKLKPKPALSLISPGGGEPHALVTEVDFFGETAWSPDGKHIAFKADQVGETKGSLWVVPASGGQVKPLRSYGVAHGYLDWSGPAVTVAAAPAAVQPVAAKPSEKPTPPVKPAAPQPVAAKPAPGPSAPIRPATPTPAAAPKPVAPVEVAAAPAEPAKAPEAPEQQSPTRIISPADGATVRGVTKIMARKESLGGYVAFFVDGAFAKATIPPFELDWDTRPAGDGPHTISVSAYAASGGVEGTAEVRLDVRNAISEDTLPQEGVILRYRFKDKEKWDYEVRVQAQAGVKGEVVLPAVAAQAGSLEAVIAQRVEAVNDLTSIKGGAAGPAAPVQAAGSAASGSPGQTQTAATIISQVRTGRLDAPGSGGWLPQAGQAARSSFTSEGEVQPIPTPGTQQPIPLGNLSIVFPQEPVKLGDKWTAPMTILPVLRSSAVARVTAEHRVDGVQWEQGLETMRIISTFKVASLPVAVGGTMPLQDVSGERTTWFAYKEHRMIRMEDHIQGTFNQGSPKAPQPGAPRAQAQVRGNQLIQALRSRRVGAALAQPAQRTRRSRFSFSLGRARGAPRRQTAPTRLSSGPGAATFGRTLTRAQPLAPRSLPLRPVVAASGTRQAAAPQAAQWSPVVHYTLNLVQVLQQ